MNTITLSALCDNSKLKIKIRNGTKTQINQFNLIVKNLKRSQKLRNNTSYDNFFSHLQSISTYTVRRGIRGVNRAAIVGKITMEMGDLVNNANRFNRQATDSNVRNSRPAARRNSIPVVNVNGPRQRRL